MKLGFFHPYTRRPDFLDSQDLAQVQKEIVESPYLGPTTLNQRFGSTLGFSVTFTRSGLEPLRKSWPSITAYLVRVLAPECNAFFLNPLVIGEGSHVGAHIDCSLRGWTKPEEPPFPSRVSVLYVDVPPDVKGGDLLIYRAGIPKAIRPCPNLLVEFLGSLRHEVSPVAQSVARPRISLVCEQYKLSRDLLSLIPPFHLNTMRSFEDFLENALQTPDSGNDGTASADFESQS